MKVASFDIVFQEIPGEVTLALNLSNCPCHCPGCHSQHLWEDIGEPLTEELLDDLLARYGSQITCVCFMGGDQDPLYVLQMAEFIQRQTTNDKRPLKTAWYSGRQYTPETLNLKPDDSPTSLNSQLSTFDYVKFGPYIESLGGLKSPTTNQRLYQRIDDRWQDITSVFWKKSL